ncbi:MAG: hypothetical protein KDM91_15675 [Verrucomicrobiae bacterium]|nr:hypothetical protein [Verrucomicrobiae bacterium]MCP5539067.1 hypothetical protein [Akkermansiaceae bacterium]MCP5551224.1 hypothetical protein [Akkermansiaceae bacterium]
MTVSIQIEDRQIVVHTDPSMNEPLPRADAIAALDAVELARIALTEHLLRHGGDLPTEPVPTRRWRIPMPMKPGE